MTNKFTPENAGKNTRSIKRQAPIFSRRGFFTLAGALGLASSTNFWEGFLIRAYADENNETLYRIYFTHRWQVPICFFDTKDASNPKGIPNATIKIVSKDTKKSVTATTDDLGVAIVDIRQMVKPVQSKNERAEVGYSFNGSIHAKANNYRTYEVRKKYFYGGEELNIASEPYSGRPYLQMACLNDWDIQYEKEVTFTASSKNDEYHNLVVKVEDVTGAVDVTLYQDGGGKTTISGVVAKNGVATASKSLKFLSTNKEHSKYALVPGKPVKIKVDVKDNPSKSFEVITNAVIQKAIEEGDYTKSDFELSLDSFVDKVQDVLPFTIPATFPVLGGEYFRCDRILPSWPVTFVFDPQGFFQAGVGYSAEYLMGEEGWKKNTLRNKWNYVKQLGEAYDHRKFALFGSFPLAKSFSVKFQLGGLVLLQWSDSLNSLTAAYRGNARLYFRLTGNATFTKQLFLGYLPVFIRFELSADTQLFLNAECELEKGSEYPKIISSSFPFVFKPEIALTAGLGVADYAAIGIRGAGYLNVTSTITAGETTSANPHVVFGAGIQASVVIQVSLFKYSYEVYSYDQPCLYDNATSSKALKSGSSSSSYTFDAYLINTPSGLGYSETVHATNGLLQAGALASAKSLANATPVTQSELSKSAEFKASAAPLKTSTSNSTTGTDPNSLYTYTPIKQAKLKAAPAQGLQSLGGTGAVMLGNPLYEQAFSDPRMKVVNVNGVPWLLRILSVTYNESGSSQTRTRLAIAKWNNANSRWDSAQVVDFVPNYGSATDNNSTTNSSNPDRIDLFDYDFSALSANDVDGLNGSWADGGVVRIFLISGTRNQGETNSAGEALAHIVGTFLSLDENLVIKTSMSFLDVYAQNAVGSAANAFGTTYNHSTLASPTILSAGTSKDNNLTVVFAFCRAAETADALIEGPYVEWPATALFDSAGFSLVSSAFACAEPGGTGYTDPVKTFLSTQKSSLSLDIIGRDYENQKQVRIGGHYVSLDEDDQSCVREFILLRNTDNTPNSQNDPGSFTLLNNSSAAHFVTAWRAGGLGGALYGTKKGLRSRAFRTNDSSQILIQNVSLSDDVDLSTFALDQNSGMLYYTTVREGTVPGDMQEDGTLGQNQTVKEYRIWASRYVTIGEKSGFIEPFPLITTQDPIDALAYVDMGDAYGFAVNSITSMADSTSTIMFYHLPFIRSVKLLDFRPTAKFVSAGERNAFIFTIQNEGNVAINEFTLSLWPTGVNIPRKLITVKLKDSDQVVPLNNPEDVANEETAAASSTGNNATYSVPVFDLATQAGILNPGKKRTYMLYWDVPEDLSGAVNLKITVVGNTDSQTDNAPGVASGEPERFRDNAVPLEVLGMSHEPVECEIDFRSDDGRSAEGDIDSLIVTNSRYVYADGETTGGGSGNTGGEDAANLAPTGDDNLSSTAGAALLAGLGLAGLGAAAFGAKNEPEPDEE